MTPDRDKEKAEEIAKFWHVELCPGGLVCSREMELDSVGRMSNSIATALHEARREGEREFSMKIIQTIEAFQKLKGEYEN